LEGEQGNPRFAAAESRGVMACSILSPSQLEAEILAFLRAELPNENAEETPIENWYRVQYVKRGHGFAPYGFATCDLLERRRRRFDRVAEIGAGIGQNCLQFAARGWRTIAVESGEEAFGWMEGLLGRLARIDPVLAGRVRPLRCIYPERASEYLNGRTLACFLGGALCPTNDEIERRMIEGLRLAGGVILDPRVFFRRRESPDEQKGLIAAIEKLGFAPPVPLWDSARERGFFPLRLIYFEGANLASDSASPARPVGNDAHSPSICSPKRIAMDG
jgi:hypothetical protein